MLVICLIVIAMSQLHSWYIGSSTTPVTDSGFLIFGLLLIALSVLVPGVVMNLGTALNQKLDSELKRLQILDNSPLGGILTKILTSKELSIPTWVTTSQLTTVHDPDCADNLLIVGASYGGGPKLAPFPARFDMWIPHYTELSSIPVPKAIGLCLASAAIPFGIVSPFEIDGVQFVDGGVADNCPLYPFQDNPKIDEVFCILLSSYPSPSDAIDVIAKPCKWRDIRRKLDLARYTGPVR